MHCMQHQCCRLDSSLSLMTKSKRQIIALICGLVLVTTSSSVFSALVLTLAQAEKMALVDEPGIVSQQWQMQSLSVQSIADGQLNDPKLQVILNIVFPKPSNGESSLQKSASDQGRVKDILAEATKDDLAECHAEKTAQKSHPQWEAGW